MTEKQKEFMEALFLRDLFNTKDGQDAYIKILEYVDKNNVNT